MIDIMTVGLNARKGPHTEWHLSPLSTCQLDIHIVIFMMMVKSKITLEVN
mgnify:CR=1 FL=1